MKTYRKFLVLGILFSLNFVGNLNASNLYGLGELFGWDSSNPTTFVQSPEPGVFVIEKAINYYSDDKQFKFTLDKGAWDQVRYLVPNAVNYNGNVQTITTGSEYDMFLCSQSSGNLLDHFWGIPSGTDGYYRLIVNTNTMKLKVEWIPYIVGSAVFCAWDLGQAPRLSPNGNNTFTYTGWFSADQEFKFQTKPDWGSISLRNGAGSTGYINGSGTLVEKQGGADDWKFMLSESGNYKITCNLSAMTITAQKLDYQTTHIKYPALYLIGSATQGAWSLMQTTPVVWQKNNIYTAKVSLTSGGSFKITTDPYRGFDNNFFFFKDAIDETKISTDATNDRQWSVSQTGDYIVSINLDDMSIHIRKYNVCSSTGNWTNTSNWSFGTVPTSSDIVVVNSGELTVDQTANAFQVKLLPGAKLTVSTGQSLTVSDSLMIESDASGTATFVNHGTTNITKATVQQYLASARNWYISSPVSTTTVPLGSTYFGYQEAGDNTYLSVSGASAYWKPYVAGSSMTVGKGFIAQPGSTTTLIFAGDLNDGDKTINLTRTTGKTKEGFNLVGNPYPSYLNWSLVTADPLNANISTTMWFRTKTTGNLYTFSTYNSTGDISVANNATTTISKFIPPMQAFWVRVNNGTVSTNLTFKNTMRAHKDINGNIFKAPRLDNQQLLRLQVSNGTNTDEAVVYFNTNASKGFDSFDSQKMFNNNEDIPEIYTVVENEKLVINGMSELKSDTVIPLEFVAGKEKTYVLTVNEMKNFSESTNIFLIDKLENTSTLLNEGGSYRFTADVTPASSNRFNLLFKVPAISTKVENNLNSIIYSYVNSANQITIISPEKSEYSIYNAVGQKIIGGFTTNNYFTVNSKLQTGMFVVKIGDNYSTRVIIK